MRGTSRTASGPQEALRLARRGPLRPLLPGPLRLAAALLLAACVAVTAIFGVLASRGRPIWLDSVLDPRFQAASARFPSLVNRLGDLGTLKPVTLMTLALILACVATRRWSGAVLAAVAEPVATGLTEYVLKPLVGTSFPSGHATSMFALAAICAVLLADSPRGRGPGGIQVLLTLIALLLTLIALLVAAAVAAAMVAAGAHVFTDAVGGAAVGTGVVLACALTLDALASLLRRGPARGVGSGQKGARMSSSPESPHLDNHHRNTLRQIFDHPVSHNIEWHSVTSLLEAVGTVTVHRDGKVTVTVGPERTVFDPPAGKDIDTQMVVDLRHMLSKAGYDPS